nr:glycosyltransferase family 4 protein [Propionibacterium sp.]
MRICYINHYAGGPSLGMEFRPHALAERWLARGHEVTIIAASFSHLRRTNPEVGRDGELHVIDGVPFRFIKTRSYHGNGLDRVLTWVEFVGKGMLAARRIAELLRPDAVIASSTYPMDTWFAARVARLAGARLVHEVHDLWPLTPIELGGYSPRHPLMALMARAERDAYRASDVIVSILPNIEPHVRGLGIDTPVVHIPNGVEVTTPSAEAPADLIALIDGLRTSGRKLIGYAGGMATSNAMDTFIDAMGRLTDEPITAILLGDGLLRPELEAQATRLGADVRFVGSIPKAQVGDALRRLDALYIGSRRSRLYEYGVSANKIFDYLLTGVPIVDAFATEHSPLVYAGCAIRAEAEDSASIAAAIHQAVNLAPEDAAERGRRGVEYVRAHHSMDALADAFLTSLQRL